MFGGTDQMSGTGVADEKPDPVLGERLCLYVTLERGASVGLDDVLDVMDGAGVARFKFPERLVVVDEFPMTKVGKIDKKAMREDIRQRLERAEV
ncbi:MULTISPECIES: AMP-binding enzyme [unclassified Gordonia (in: high G+C Gram-positive bacteria)]